MKYKLISLLLHLSQIIFLLIIGYTVHTGVDWFFYESSYLKIIIGFIISIFGLGAMVYLYRRGLERIQSIREDIMNSFEDDGGSIRMIVSKLGGIKDTATREVEGLSVKLALLLIVLKFGQYLEVYLPLNPAEQIIQSFISLIYLMVIILILLPFTK